MTLGQDGFSFRGQKKCKGISELRGRSLGEDRREGDVKWAEAGWSPQHPR